MPLIGTISGAEALRTPANHFMFHLRASYEDETEPIVRNLTTVGMTRIGVFYQHDAFGQAGLAGVQKALAAKGLKPVAIGSSPRNSVDVAAAVKAMSAANAQAIVMASLYRPTAAFIQQMRRGGAKPYFVALSPGGADPLIGQLGGDDSRGVQVAQVIPYPWGERYEIVRDYKRDLAAYAKTAKLSYYGLEGYINARLVAAALDRTGANPTRDRLLAALRSGPFDLGVTASDRPATMVRTTSKSA